MGSRDSRRGVTLAELMAVGLGLAICALLAFPVLKKRVRERQIKECQENLTRIDGAKEEWALLNHKKPGDQPKESDLLDPEATGYLKEMPRCPSGHAYVINAIGTAPACESKLTGHELNYHWACAITTVE